MKRIMLGLAMFLVSTAAFAQRPLNVWIKISPTISSSGMVSGTTNLPDGTILNVVLGAVTPSDNFNKDGCFDGEGAATVAVSRGSFGPVYVGTGRVPCLKRGSHYVAFVQTMAPFLQPASVIAVIGKHGSNLAGPLVSGSGIGRGVKASIPVEVQ